MNSKINKAITAIQVQHKFFGSAVMKMPWIADPSAQTAYTDGDTVHYCPTFVESLPHDMVVGLVIHEVLHPFLNHLYRLEPQFKANPHMANTAADYELNNFITAYNGDSAFPISLPDGGLIDHVKWGSRSCESIFKELSCTQEPKDEKPSDGDGESKPSDGDGESKPSDGDGDGESKPSDGDGESKPSDGDGDGDGESKPGDGDGDGDGESKPGDGDGEPKPGDGQGKGEATFGEFRLPKDEAKLVESRNEWANIMQSSIQTAKLRGDGGGKFIQHLENSLSSPIDLESLLSRYVTEFCLSDESTKPDRRYLADWDMCIAGMESERHGTLVFVKDTSGSINAETLQSCVAVIQNVLDTMDFDKLVVLDVDYKVCDAQTFYRNDEIPATAKGRGGTDFRPAFNYVEEEVPEARALVYLTDGYGAFPANEPDIPTLWISYGKDISQYPFGHAVDLSDVEL